MSTSLLTADDLATSLGVCKRTVMTWLADGRIPAAIRERHTLRFDEAMVRKALAKRATQAACGKQSQTDPSRIGMVPTY